jgi:preprotein translocase subunit SecF
MNYHFDFMRIRKGALLSSLALVLVSVVLFLTRGLNWGIDFTGGTVIQISFERSDVTVGTLRELIGGDGQAVIQSFGDDAFIIRVSASDEASRERILDTIRERYQDVDVLGFEAVGPVIGAELRQNAVIGLMIALIAILIYITLRFQFRFGVVSVVPLLHDAIVTVGFFSLFQLEISSSFIAAILTVVGYSLNNTIIILDRIRENWRALPTKGIINLVNESTNQTLSRTLYTTLTTLLPVIALCIWGGPVLRGLSLALLVGIVAGTYSSIYVATGIICEWWLKKPLKN